MVAEMVQKESIALGGGDMDKSYRIYLSEVCLSYMVFMVRYSYDQMTRMFPTLYCRT